MPSRRMQLGRGSGVAWSGVAWRELARRGVALFVASLAAAPVSGQEHGENVPDAILGVEYLANAGFILRAGPRTVVLDGAFSEGLEYPHPDTAAVFRRLTAEDVRAGGLILLASHIHLDHVDPAVAVRLLEAVPDARFIGPPRVIDTITTVGRHVDGLAERLVAVTLAPGETTVVYRDQEVVIEATRLHHPQPQNAAVQNLAYLVRRGGASVLHPGDAEVSARNFAEPPPSWRGVGLFLAPYWFLHGQQGRLFTWTAIEPKRVVAIHLLSDQPADPPMAYPWAELEFATTPGQRFDVGR